jgi:hypothetical protein
MASYEGAQVDTLPIQLYGVDSDGVIRKLAVDSTGKIVLTAEYLKLDQTVPQSMNVSGKWAFVWNANTLELYVNGVIRHSWTTTPVAPAAGSYLGFGAFTTS